MAWTQSDIDALDEVIASGALTVRTPEGVLVTYQNLDELRALRRAMELEVASLTIERTNPRYQTAVFCDDC